MLTIGFGLPFSGPTSKLHPCPVIEVSSHVIQVPHGGQPIIQMRDAQPSGGYPKIGTVIAADLWRLGQAPIGSRIRFVQCTWAEAVSALDDVDGLDWKTAVRCDFIYALNKTLLREQRGRVTEARQIELLRKLRFCFRWPAV